MTAWKKIDGKVYTINVVRGNISTVGNGGDIYWGISMWLINFPF